MAARAVVHLLPGSVIIKATIGAKVVGKLGAAFDAIRSDFLLGHTQHAQNGLGGKSINLMVLGHGFVMARATRDKEAAAFCLYLALPGVMLAPKHGMVL